MSWGAGTEQPHPLPRREASGGWRPNKRLGCPLGEPFFHEPRFLLGSKATNSAYSGFRYLETPNTLLSKVDKANPSLWGKRIAKDTISAFERKLEFWQTYIHHHELDSFLVLKDFSDEVGVTLRKQLLIWRIDLCQKLSIAGQTAFFRMANPIILQNHASVIHSKCKVDEQILV